MRIRWLALLPVAAFLIGVFFANRVYPLVFGMPFLFFYMALCVVLTAASMAVVDHFDPANREEG